VDRKKKSLPRPGNHLDIGVLRLPTFARNQAGDWLVLMSQVGSRNTLGCRWLPVEGETFFECDSTIIQSYFGKKTTTKNIRLN